jgi:hypothetical protein
VVGEIACFVLSRVECLAPGFPFDGLLDEFATPEEEAAVAAAVSPIVDEVKRVARRD